MPIVKAEWEMVQLDKLHLDNHNVQPEVNKPHKLKEQNGSPEMHSLKEVHKHRMWRVRSRHNVRLGLNSRFVSNKPRKNRHKGKAGNKRSASSSRNHRNKVGRSHSANKNPALLRSNSHNV